MKGELKNTETWEAKLSAAGQKAADGDDLASLKADAWKLIITKENSDTLRT